MDSDKDKVRHFDVHQPMLEQIGQTMLELKKMGRSIENGADALTPLTSNETIAEALDDMAEYGRKAADRANKIYKMIAREAAGNG